MEATPKQQILRSIKEAKNILLLSHKNIDGDGLSSMVALYITLKKLGKKVTAFTPNAVPKALNFLPKVEDYITDKADASNDFIITLDCSNAKVEKLKYNIIEDKVNIIITPKEGNFDEKDIATTVGGSKYDAIIVLDTGDINHIGSLYEDNTNLFFNTNVLNIDHHATNTFFGTSNLVNPKATSTCEITLGLIEALESQYSQKLLDKDIATYLLTGLIVDTNSFQNQNTTPKGFSVAAQLLALGADQQTIIKNLYKTHTLPKLKLWGRALSNIREDKETRMVWSVLSKQDFSDTEAKDAEIDGLIDELLTSAPGADLVFILREHSDGQVHCSIRSLGTSDAGKLASLFNGGGHKKAAGFKIKGDSLEKVENYVVKKFRDYKLGILELPNAKKETIVQKQAPIVNERETKEFINKVQEIKKPQVNTHKPEIKIPNIPNVNIPKPEIKTPEMPKPVVNIPKPEIKIPDIPEVKIPKPETPSIPRPDINRPNPNINI